MKRGSVDSAIRRFLRRLVIPPGLMRSPFLLASASATLNFGINQWRIPQSADIVGIPINLEKYWGLILIFAALASFLGILLPRGWHWDWFFRFGVWAMFSAWSFTAILLFSTSGSATYIGGFLALAVATASVVDILKFDIFKSGLGGRGHG